MTKRILAAAAGLFQSPYIWSYASLSSSRLHQSSISLDQKIEDSFIISREEFRHMFRD